MEWIALTTEDQLQEIHKSNTTTLIFKHSYTCFISKRVLRFFEEDADSSDKKIPAYFLDILLHRPLSNFIAQAWHVQHESPQILVIKGNECLFEASHGDINFEDILPFFD